MSLINSGSDLPNHGHFNVSAWGIAHSSVVFYFLIALSVMGLLSYTKLGQSEDPPFTFKVMVVGAEWPGATAEEVALQVTDKIEKKLQEIPQLDYVRSYSRPGESMVFFVAKDSTPAGEIPDVWYQARKKIGDIHSTFPTGVIGPYFNDEFGDTYGNIFALVGEGVSHAELKRHAEAIRSELLQVRDVAKVNFFGEQSQRVFVELSNTKLATFGLALSDIAAAFTQQNAMTGAGFFETNDERVWLRPTGQYESLDSIRDTMVRAQGRTFRLGDVADIYHGYADPPDERMRFMGHDAFGIGVSMRAGGDIIALGHHLDQVVARIDEQLPVGLKLERVADQPRAVHVSVNEFVRVLIEAVVIVMGVSLLSLGFRTGVVVLIVIPVVLSITFLFMEVFGIGLHKISLGTLILALGLLVDDAIIAVEMMATKMEQGWERAKAGSFAYISTAMPMLSGTLVTAAGFLPIATAASATGEYTRSIFQVAVIALLTSWVAAVLFVPCLGYYLLPDFIKNKEKHTFWSWLSRKLFRRGKMEIVADQMKETVERHPDPLAIYHTPFYCKLRVLITWGVTHRWLVVVTTVLLFLGSLVIFSRFVPEQFFPDSTRLELMVDLRLVEGASHQATERAVRKLETFLDQQTGIENYVAWLGAGSPRFYLPLDQQLAQTSFAQFVVLTKSNQDREQIRTRLIDYFETQPDGVRGVVNRLENGPPVGFPVQYRVRGPEIETVRQFAERIAALMRDHPALSNVQFDWEEPVKAVHLRIDQEKARLMGLSSEDIASVLAGFLQGQTISQFREGIETVQIVLRGTHEDRVNLNLLADFMLQTKGGHQVPLAQVARLEYGFEEGVIWRRNRLSTVTVRATLYGKKQPASIVKELSGKIEEIRAAMPLGLHLEVGGAVEESAKGGKSISAGLPLFVLTVLTILMLQLKNFSRTVMVVSTAPLGMIGVSAFLLIFDQPFGFVAMLGTIALFGMIMRNSVILIDQIRQDLESGHTPWEAVIESAVRRFRPIMLTASAAILAMIPLSRTGFFGPMAVAIMGGLTVATVLTILFLPALYAAWYKVQRVER